MMSSVLDMASTNPSQILTLTLDLNSSPLLPAVGVLQTFSLISSAGLGVTGYFRILHGTFAYKFTYTGVEENPKSHNTKGSRNELDGVTLAPETDFQHSVEAEVTEILLERPSDIPTPDQTSETSTSVDEDPDAASDSDYTPIPTTGKERRKHLHHPKVSNDPCEETDSEDSIEETTNKKRRLRSNTPAKGAIAEPALDASDVFASDGEPPTESQRMRTRSGVECGRPLEDHPVAWP